MAAIHSLRAASRRCAARCVINAAAPSKSPAFTASMAAPHTSQKPTCSVGISTWYFHTDPLGWASTKRQSPTVHTFTGQSNRYHRANTAASAGV